MLFRILNFNLTEFILIPSNFSNIFLFNFNFRPPHIFPPPLISHPSLSERLIILNFKFIPTPSSFVSDPSLSERHLSSFAYLNFHLNLTSHPPPLPPSLFIPYPSLLLPLNFFPRDHIPLGFKSIGK